MRLLHTADWHAGRTLSRRGLDEGLEKSLTDLTDYAVLLAGAYPIDPFLNLAVRKPFGQWPLQILPRIETGKLLRCSARRRRLLLSRDD